MTHFTPESLKKMKEGGRRGGLVKNPRKGFGSNRELARQQAQRINQRKKK